MIPILIDPSELKSNRFLAEYVRAIEEVLPARRHDLAEPFDGDIAINVGFHLFGSGKKFRESADRLRRLKVFISVQNDYLTSVPTQWRQALADVPTTIVLSTMPDLLSRCKGKAFSWIKEVRYAPMTAMVYKELPYAEPLQHGLLFYGCYRDQREDGYRRYIGGPYPMWIGGGINHFIKFRNLGMCRHADKILPPEDIQIYSASLYLDDDQTWNRVTCRFFEIVGAGVALLVDAASIPAFEAHGIPLRDEWVVRGHEDVVRALSSWRAIREDQKILRRDWRGDALESLRSALKEFA